MISRMSGRTPRKPLPRRSEQESIDDEGTAKRHHFPPNSLGSQGGGD